MAREVLKGRQPRRWCGAPRWITSGARNVLTPCPSIRSRSARTSKGRRPIRGCRHTVWESSVACSGVASSRIWSQSRTPTPCWSLFPTASIPARWPVRQHPQCLAHRRTPARGRARRSCPRRWRRRRPELHRPLCRWPGGLPGGGPGRIPRPGPRRVSALPPPSVQWSSTAHRNARREFSPSPWTPAAPRTACGVPSTALRSTARARVRLPVQPDVAIVRHVLTMLHLAHGRAHVRPAIPDSPRARGGRLRPHRGDLGGRRLERGGRGARRASVQARRPPPPTEATACHRAMVMRSRCHRPTSSPVPSRRRATASSFCGLARG